MPLIQGQLKQHTVEFIYGTGIVFDGVRIDNTSTTGPFTFQTSESVLNGVLDGCGAGGGGGGGSTSTTEAAGGGGGSSGLSITDFEVHWPKGGVITVTLGIAGTGGAAGSAGTNGTDTTVTGLLTNQVSSLSYSGTAGEIRISGGVAGQAATTSGSGVGGGNVLATGGASATNGATAVNGVSGTEYIKSAFGNVYLMSGASGGNASTTVTVAGGAGGGWAIGLLYLGGNGAFASQTTQVGGENGTASWGGGGLGGASLFGVPGVGVSTIATAAANATGFGAGGTGGNGQSAGSNGSPGYLKLTYWSTN